MIKWSTALLIGIIPIILVLSACSPIASQGQSSLTQTQYAITSETSIGQTFTSRQNGLTGIRFYLVTQNATEANLFLSVYDSPTKNNLVSTGSLKLEPLGESGYYTIDLDSPLTSYLRDYYIEITSDSQEPIGVGTAELNTYADGALYQNNDPVSAQLTFVPLFDPLKLAWGLIRQGSTWFLWLLAGIYLFLIPGYGLLLLFRKNASDWPLLVKVSGAVAISVSLYPLLMLFTRIIKLQLGVYYAILPGAVGVIYLMVRWFKAGRLLPKFSLKHPFKVNDIPTITSAVVIFVIIFIRLWAIRALPLPMWGDTIHHTMIAQLMLDNGGLFDSWRPYAEMLSMNYHFGFHSAIAVFAWLTRMPSPEATLVVGQLMNIFAVIAIYGLAWKMAKRNRWAGIVALVVAGLISFLPMFYVNWSRYTQLAGQVVLPFLILATWEAAENATYSLKEAILIGFLAAGLALNHYRVAVFFLALVPILMITYTRKDNWRSQAALWGTAGGAGALFILPWFLKIYGGRLFNHMSQQVATPAGSVGDFTQQYNSIGYFTNYMPALLWLILLLAIIYSLWRKEKGGGIMLGWWLVILLLANPAILGLPGTGAISNFAVFIAMYIPAGIFIGAAVGWLIEKPYEKWPKLTHAAIAILIIAISLAAGKSRLLDVQPDTYALATRADLRAAGWIRDNLPDDARILVNSFLAYGGSTLVGSDAGWWLPTLTGRQTSAPPMLYGTEQGPNPEYAQSVNYLRLLAESKGFTHPDFLAELKARGINYAFIGQKNGGVNSGGSIVLNPAELIASGYYLPIYHQDAVWVFEIRNTTN